VTTSLAVRRFFRTPKGLVLIVLGILLALATPTEGFKLVWPGLLSAAAVAGLMDLLILRWKNDDWEFPSGAILSALFIMMVLSPHEAWYVPACASVIAVGSKYILRTRSANVFNPAALAIVIAFYAFHTPQNWWGALPELPSFMLIVLFAAGIFITDRVNKIPLVLVFLGVYFLLFSITSFLGDPAKLAEIFRAPDLHAALFFAFFILTDPPTSPVKYNDQIICGVIVAVVGYVSFQVVGAAYYLLAGVLVGNIWEAWRRVQAASRRVADRSVSLAGD
jgi:Na+-translocating ferredoxin:NAD+ oxidoreductase RnfD subunit